MDRVDAMMEAWAGEPTTVETDFGAVTLSSVEPGGDGTVRWVDVTVEDPQGGDPQFRVINPPAKVNDEYDPVRALAHVIGSAGGTRIGRA